jgi:4-carboxymuconolactone decarboxylase
MRLSIPRIPPVQDEEADEAQRAILADLAKRGMVLNVFRTFLHYPDAAKPLLGWSGYIYYRNAMASRERELAVLRTTFLCKSGYEWVEHARIGLSVGLTEAEVAAIKKGPEHPSWGELDRLILKTADELVGDKFVSNATWAALAEHLNRKQLMDLVFTISHYTQACMFVNSFGVQLEEGLTLDPDLDAT